MEIEQQKPSVKTMCLFIYNDKVLATKGYDEKKKEIFYRVIGGTLEFGETSEDGVKREVMEELGCDIKKLTFLQVVENIFTFNNLSGHEIVFLYKGELANEELYHKEKINITEPYGQFTAEWIPTEDVLGGRKILYPSLDYLSILK